MVRSRKSRVPTMPFELQGTGLCRCQRFLTQLYIIIIIIIIIIIVIIILIIIIIINYNKLYLGTVVNKVNHIFIIKLS